jgi:hypothetical protein
MHGTAKSALADLRNVYLPISGKPEIGAVALRGSAFGRAPQDDGDGTM